MRTAIEKIGGTMPEDLPTPEKSIQQIEKEQMERLKLKAKKGKLMLDEPVEHAKLIQICLHNGIACLHHGRLGFLLAVGMSDVANGISIIILSEFYINEKYITHTDTVFSGNFLRRRTCPAARYVW